MREQLAAAAKETEAALVQLKRERLLRQLDAMGAAGGGAGAPGQGPEEEQQQQEEPPTAPAADGWQPGQRCVFRQADGRFYFGVVLERAEGGGGGGGAVALRFATPTRPHQLAPLALPPGALLPAPAAPPLALHQLELGARVVVQPPGAALWVGAEVASLDPAEGLVAAMTSEVRALAGELF